MAISNKFSIIDNDDLLKAVNLLNNTDLCVFLSGKAGSGKTTLLQNLKSLTYKRFLIAAPTGIAALNANGGTIHSLFQLPIGKFYTPGSGFDKDFRLNSERKKLIRNLDLLVIDEVSMVRADILDAVDQVLKRVRDSLKVFGGVQVLFVGDLFQLPPVCTREEWNMLSRFYESPFFIDAKSFSAATPITIELEKVYRQNDPTFINILNELRTNSITKNGLDTLNQHVISQEVNYSAVTLTTHNELADRINANRLEDFGGDLIELNAVIDGNFDTSSVIADVTLQLKVGAPVMLIRNYEHDNTVHYNGKIGLLESMYSDRLVVRFDDQVVPIRKTVWQNFEYSFDENERVVTGRVIGSFEQFPVRLAWAITIHKSQGLSFDTAIIDTEMAFAGGQVYVALSRLRSIEGLMLSAPLTARQVKVDPRILRFFASDANRFELLTQDISRKKTEYLKAILAEWFDLSHLAVDFSQAGANDKTGEIVKALAAFDRHAKKFMKELNSIFSLEEEERYLKLSSRISAAAVYFENELSAKSGAIRELIKTYDGEVLYKKVLIFLKILRKAIDQKCNELKAAKKIADQISFTRDIGLILLGGRKK